MTRDAQKRLSVLQQFTELGAGFQIASHDLELRGAELPGEVRQAVARQQVFNIENDFASGDIEALDFRLAGDHL